MKQIKGEKYIYLLMGFMLANQNKEKMVQIGKDNGYVGGQNFYRRFKIQEYNNETILIEPKTSKSFADFTKAYMVRHSKDNPDAHAYIYEYIDESGDNCSKNWVH